LGPLCAPDGPGAVVGVFEDGKVRYWRGFGRQKLGGPPISPATLFDLGSNTKQFVAAVILLLQQRKKLSLEDEVQRFLPRLPRYGRPLRLRHLLYHTSGLRDCGNMEGVADRDHFGSSRAGYLRCAYRQKELNFKTGSRHFYSNTNYVLLAEVAARAAGRSFAALLRENIFLPAGMRDSFVTPLKEFPHHRFAQAYFQYGKAWHPCPLDLSDHITGAAGLYSNLYDFDLWIQALALGLIGGKSLTKRLFQPGTLDDGTALDYGAGVFVGQMGRQRLISHGGSTQAWNSQYHWLPRRGLLVACFASHPAVNVWGLVPDLTRHLLGIRPPRHRKEAAVAAAPPAPKAAPAPVRWSPAKGQCEGRYWSPEGLCGLRVSSVSGRLSLELLRSGPRRLRPLELLRPGRYSLELFPPSTELEFEGLDQAKAPGLRLHFGEGSRVFSLRFQRVSR
jgi:CubicO group peptidase (beta-lactamase class C family)